ncbi:MAG: hypothetical protein BWX66_01062 [Deltaproteobacteria bacterium ADurb.Bin058]|nr:MAG: hypothetical protein BWX66_01062 [Deltaproteobacteria bacterium ADurb.Bin058]
MRPFKSFDAGSGPNAAVGPSTKAERKFWDTWSCCPWPITSCGSSTMISSRRLVSRKLLNGDGSPFGSQLMSASVPNFNVTESVVKSILPGKLAVRALKLMKDSSQSSPPRAILAFSEASSSEGVDTALSDLKTPLGVNLPSIVMCLGWSCSISRSNSPTSCLLRSITPSSGSFMVR